MIHYAVCYSLSGRTEKFPIIIVDLNGNVKNIGADLELADNRGSIRSNGDIKTIEISKKTRLAWDTALALCPRHWSSNQIILSRALLLLE